MFGTFDRSRDGVYNWSCTNLLCPHSQVQSPASEEEIIAIIARVSRLQVGGGKHKVRMIGSGLSYEALCKLDDGQSILLSLENYRGLIRETENTATFKAGTALQEVFNHLISKKKMLPASPGVIGIQTIAGAIATGTHGQGMNQSTISDTIEEIKMITGTGEVQSFTKDNKEFGALIMHYGSLGVIVEVTLRTVPMETLTCTKITTDYTSLLEVFSRMNETSSYAKAWWFPETDDVHIWQVNSASATERRLYDANNRQLTSIDAEINGKLNETIDGIIVKMSRETCDDKLEGRQFETVQRFKDVTNVVGDIYQVFCKGIPVPQINCEVAVPFERMNEALYALRQWFKHSEHTPHYPFILRCTGESQAFLSGAYNRKVCWIGFLVYLAKDGSFIQGSLEMMRELQEVLAKFDGVPHLGKHFIKQIFDLPRVLPKWNEFKELRKQFDPVGIFENEFLRNFFSNE